MDTKSQAPHASTHLRHSILPFPSISICSLSGKNLGQHNFDQRRRISPAAKKNLCECLGIKQLALFFNGMLDLVKVLQALCVSGKVWKRSVLWDGLPVNVSSNTSWK